MVGEGKVELGCFTVQKVINPVAVWLKLPHSMRVHPTFHVSKVKPVHNSPLVPAALPPLPPRIVDGGLCGASPYALPPAGLSSGPVAFAEEVL